MKVGAKVGTDLRLDGSRRKVNFAVRALKWIYQPTLGVAQAGRKEAKPRHHFLYLESGRCTSREPMRRGSAIMI